MQYVPIPITKSANGTCWITGTLMQLFVVAEVSTTRIVSFLLNCPYNGYVDKFGYGNELVNIMFIDGNDSYLFVKETHSQIIEKHFVGKDTVTDQYVSAPYLIEIGRNGILPRPKSYEELQKEKQEAESKKESE